MEVHPHQPRLHSHSYGTITKLHHQVIQVTHSSAQIISRWRILHVNGSNHEIPSCSNAQRAAATCLPEGPWWEKCHQNSWIQVIQYQNQKKPTYKWVNPVGYAIWPFPKYDAYDASKHIQALPKRTNTLQPSKRNELMCSTSSVDFPIHCSKWFGNRIS